MLGGSAWILASESVWVAIKTTQYSHMLVYMYEYVNTVHAHVHVVRWASWQLTGVVIVRQVLLLLER